MPENEKARDGKLSSMTEKTPDLQQLVGKTVASARQETSEYHSLDSDYEQDGDVVIEFTDGSSITVTGYWCNDGTASTEYKIAEPR
jgi:hypothetical protein